MTAPDILARYILQGIQDQVERPGRHSFHDVTIKIKSRSFKCHRLLLSAASRFFRDKFSLDSTVTEVLLDGIEPAVFELVLDFIYKGKNMMKLSNVMDIWRASHTLAINKLEELCENFLSRHLSNDNIVDIYVNAKAMDNAKLLHLSWDLIVINFDDLKTSDEILRLDFADMKRLIALPYLQVSDEDLIIGLILRWVQREDLHDESTSTSDLGSDYEILIESTNEVNRKGVKSTRPSDETDLKTAELDDSDSSCYSSAHSDFMRSCHSREKFLADLLRASKICLVSGPRLQNLLMNDMVNRNPEALALVKKAYGYKMQSWRRGDYVPPYAIHRSTSSMVNVPIAISSKKNGSEATCSAIMSDGTWKCLASPKAELAECRAVAYGNDIYATNSGGLGTTFQFSPESNSWKQLPDMLSKRFNHGLVCHDSDIYAIGGDDNNTIERFSVRPGTRQHDEVNQWKQVGVLRKTVSNITATNFGNMIVVLGTDSEGIRPEGTRYKNVTTIQCFDTDRRSNHNIETTMAGPAKNIVCLRRGKDTYILQETGALYKIRKCDRDGVEVDFCGAVWDYKITMLTAALVFDQLVVLVKNIKPGAPRQWKTPRMELFSSVKMISVKRRPRCLLNIVIPKTYLRHEIEEEDDEDDDEEFDEEDFGDPDEEEETEVDETLEEMAKGGERNSDNKDQEVDGEVNPQMTDKEKGIVEEEDEGQEGARATHGGLQTQAQEKNANPKNMGTIAEEQNATEKENIAQNGEHPPSTKDNDNGIKGPKIQEKNIDKQEKGTDTDKKEKEKVAEAEIKGEEKEIPNSQQKKSIEAPSDATKLEGKEQSKSESNRKNQEQKTSEANEKGDAGADDKKVNEQETEQEVEEFEIIEPEAGENAAGIIEEKADNLTGCGQELQKPKTSTTQTATKESPQTEAGKDGEKIMEEGNNTGRNEEVGEIEENNAEIADTKETKGEVADTKETNAEVADTKETKAKVAGKGETNEEVADTKKTNKEVADTKETNAEVAGKEETKKEVPDTKETNAEVAEKEETNKEVTDTKETNKEIADTKETNEKVAGKEETNKEVADIKETNIEVADTKETNAEVAGKEQTKKEVADTKETKEEVAEKEETNKEVTDTKETNAEVAGKEETNKEVADTK